MGAFVAHPTALRGHRRTEPLAHRRQRSGRPERVLARRTLSMGTHPEMDDDVPLRNMIPDAPPPNVRRPHPRRSLRCPVCLARGKVRCDRCGGSGKQGGVQCEVCFGLGKLKCTQCGGTGFILQEEDVA